MTLIALGESHWRHPHRVAFDQPVSLGNPPFVYPYLARTQHLVNMTFRNALADSYQEIINALTRIFGSDHDHSNLGSRLRIRGSGARNRSILGKSR